jgi:hypothetical protein
VHTSDRYLKQQAKLVMQRDFPIVHSPQVGPSSRTLHIPAAADGSAARPSPSAAGDSAAHPSPSAAKTFELSWDPHYNAPGPAYDLLVGGTGYFAGLDLASAALFWCSETTRTEGHYLAAKRHLIFTRSMLSDALTRCIAPSTNPSQTRRVQFVGPSTSGAGMAKTELEGESGKGKGRANPMDKDEPELPALPSDEGEGDFGFGSFLA